MADCLPLAASSQRPWSPLAPPPGRAEALSASREATTSGATRTSRCFSARRWRGRPPPALSCRGYVPLTVTLVGRSSSLPNPSPLPPPLLSLAGPHLASGVRYQPFSGAPRSLRRQPSLSSLPAPSPRRPGLGQSFHYLYSFMSLHWPGLPRTRHQPLASATNNS